MDEDDRWPLLVKEVTFAISWALDWMVPVNCPTGISGESDDEVHVEVGQSTLNGVAGTSRFIFSRGNDPIVQQEDPPLNCRNFQLHSDPCGLRYTQKPTQRRTQ